MDAIIIITFAIAMIVLILIGVWFFMSFIIPMFFGGKSKCVMCETKHRKLNILITRGKKYPFCESCDTMAQRIVYNFPDIIEHYEDLKDLENEEKEKDEKEMLEKLKNKLEKPKKGE